VVSRTRTRARHGSQEARAKLKGCRVVTTSMTARLLIRNQLQSLDEVDWTVVSGDSYNDPPEGIKVEVVPIRREFAASDLVAFVRLLRFFRSARFDVVQTHTPKASFLGLPAARLSGSVAIYTIHGSLFFAGNGRLANALGWMFEKWCSSWATQVVVQSRQDEKALPRALICSARKLSYVGNGIDLDRFTQPVAPLKPLENERPVVLMVSRLVREKGCVDFLRVAHTLAGRAEFVHVGPFEHDQSDALSESEVAAAQNEGTVNFIGGVDDVRPYLAAADLVVLPSYREGIPRAAMEAAASGRAVVAYDIRGVREVIQPETGLLVPRGDTVALEKKVASLLDDPEGREELGRRCRAHVIDGFSEDAVVARLRTLYARVARHP